MISSPAFASGLPCSWVSSGAMRSAFAWSAAAQSLRTLRRSASSRLHAGNARRAASIASSSSAFVQSGTSVNALPVAGLITPTRRLPGRDLPSIVIVKVSMFSSEAAERSPVCVYPRAIQRGSARCQFCPLAAAALHEFFVLAHVLGAAECHRDALGNLGRLHVEDALAAGGRRSAGLLDDHRHRRHLVEQSELRFGLGGIAAIGRVEKDTAAQQDAVKIGDQRADVTQSVRPARRLVALLQIAHVAARPFVPALRVPFVHAVALAAFRDTDVLVREQELAER